MAISEPNSNSGRKEFSLDEVLNFNDPAVLIESLSAIGKDNPRSANVHLLLSRINMLKGHLSIAAEGFNYLTSLYPSNSLAFYEYGVCEFYRANFEAAIVAFKRALEIDSSLIMAAFWLGKCYKLEFRTEEVIEIYEDLTKKYPEWSIFACELGLAYETLRQDEKAIACFEKVVKLTNTNAIAYYHLGNLYARGGRILDAMQAYKNGLKVNPSSKLLKDGIERISDVAMP